MIYLSSAHNFDFSVKLKYKEEWSYVQGTSTMKCIDDFYDNFTHNSVRLKKWVHFYEEKLLFQTTST